LTPKYVPCITLIGSLYPMTIIPLLKDIHENIYFVMINRLIHDGVKNDLRSKTVI